MVECGEVSEDIIDEAVRRILRIKFAKGLFEHPYCEMPAVNREAHLKDARELAAESMVLLENKGVLPLSKDAKVA